MFCLRQSFSKQAEHMCAKSQASLQCQVGYQRQRHLKSLRLLKKCGHNSQHSHNFSPSQKSPHWWIENKSLLTESLKWQNLAPVPTILHWNVTSCHFLLPCVHAHVYEISPAAADEETNYCCLLLKKIMDIAKSNSDFFYFGRKRRRGRTQNHVPKEKTPRKVSSFLVSS